MDPILPSMKEALNEWLNLLQGPTDTLFAQGTEFADGWKSLFRLIVLVLLMLMAVLTFSYVGQNHADPDQAFSNFAKNTVAQTRYSVIVILVGALFASLYALLLAPVFKVKIDIRQAFFAFLFLVLPWIPIVLFVWVLGIVLPDGPLVALFIPSFIFLIFPAMFIYQFSRGIALISGCQKGRCLASIAVPFAIVAVLILWVTFRMQDYKDTPGTPPQDSTTPQVQSGLVDRLVA
jgi:heme A synthase